MATSVADFFLTAKHDPENLKPSYNFKYRTLVAFLTGAGGVAILLCPQMPAVEMKGTPVHHDVSWHCIGENTNASHTAHRFSFGSDGYVQQFADEQRDGLPISRSVPAWRVTYGTLPHMILMAKQCSMPPADIVDGKEIGAWPGAYRGQAYNSRLAASKAVKVGGRHYAMACLHSQLPED